MKLKFNIHNSIKIAVAIAVVLMFIVFTEARNGEVSIQDITIRIENVHDNHFLDEADIASLMGLSEENLRGADLRKVDLRAIENKIKKNPFIRKADMYSDLKGNLVARVELRRPVARLVRNDGPDGYIAEDGTIMPVSEKFTARVLLVTGPYVKKLLQQSDLTASEEGKQLLELITLIREDDFWNAQIAQLDVNHKGRITFLTQVGDERIEFGYAETPEVKLKKLMIFYKEILPRVGWNKYKRVNLEYEGQIVAE